MGFDQLLNNLLDRARLRIRNGQLTESGLARLAGISQPQMHHILSGKRGLHPRTADRLLDALSLDITDLTEIESGSAASLARQGTPASHSGITEHAVLVPMLEGLIGAGYPLPRDAHPPIFLPLPRREIPRDCILYAARLAHDPALEPLFLRDDLVVIAMNPLPRAIEREAPGLPQVFGSGGNWYVRLPGAGFSLNDSLPTGEPGAGSGAFVGVIALTVRRMHPLQLPLPPSGNDD